MTQSIPNSSAAATTSSHRSNGMYPRLFQDETVSRPAPTARAKVASDGHSAINSATVTGGRLWVPMSNYVQNAKRSASVRMAPKRAKRMAKRPSLPNADQLAIAGRLKRAREEAGYETAAEAARAMGINATSYQHHENGRRGLRKGEAARYASFFNTTVGFLLNGEILHQPSHMRIVGFVVDSGAIEMLDAAGSTEAQAAYQPEIPPFGTGPYEIFIIQTDSLWPAFNRGDFVYYRPQRPGTKADLSKLNGKYCVIEREDGTQALRLVTVQPEGLVTLSSQNRPPEINVRIKWGCRVEWNRQRD